MGGIGLPEILIILLLFLVIYPIIMMVDAIRRPSEQYRFGNKKMWVALFVLSNPLIAEIYGNTIGSIALLIFIGVSIAYHAKNRWKNPIAKKGTMIQSNPL